MLADVSIPTLLLSLIHLTGDTGLLQGPLRPQGIYLNEVQGFMSPEDQAAARAFALEKIIEFRDQHGGLSSINQLDEVDGIGPSTMASLRAALQP